MRKEAKNARKSAVDRWKAWRKVHDVYNLATLVEHVHDAPSHHIAPRTDIWKEHARTLADRCDALGSVSFERLDDLAKLKGDASIPAVMARIHAAMADATASGRFYKAFDADGPLAEMFIDALMDLSSTLPAEMGSVIRSDLEALILLGQDPDEIDSPKAQKAGMRMGGAA